MIRPGRLHHASIRTSDLERSRRFYEDVLKLELIPRPDLGFPGVWYGLGESQLHLLELPKRLEGIDPSDPHFAIEVEDIEQTKQALRDEGVEYFELPGGAWVHDPDGYVVEFRQRS
ncbi:MAG: glyoxylase family protein [Candidatus Binatota bacterium]|jgi:catechol 2,3-dioxygenase-like lactoylglutathione lyase family enzyme|nr:glyoxylase family protein [Candidatus Binatota bacterium]